MKKVLILAYAYPPYVAVGGLRPHSWFKYFPKFGVYPIVVTRQWANHFKNQLDYVAPSATKNIEIIECENGIEIRAPFKPNLANKIMLKYGPNRFSFFRKLISFIAEFIQWYLPVGNKRTLYQAADDYLKNNKVDLIIATADPFILFKYASDLSKKHNTPWVADYRDLWSQDVSIFKNSWYIKWSEKLEKKYLKTAAHIIIVSETLKEILSELLPVPNKLVITNGYDNLLFEEINLQQKKTNKLIMGFVGTIYEWHPLETFLNTIEKVLTNNDIQIELKFYGLSETERLNNSLKQLPLVKSIVNIVPKLPNKDLIEKLTACNVLVLFNYYSFTGTKIYDYLALRRLILLCFTNDPEANKLKDIYYHIPSKTPLREDLQEEILNYTNSGKIIVDADHLYNTIIELGNKLKSDEVLNCNSVNVEEYSRELQVKKIADFVHSAF